MDGTSRRSLSISTNHDNGKFEVEERRYYSFNAEDFDIKHLLDTTEEVMEVVLDVVGTYIASREVIGKRNDN